MMPMCQPPCPGKGMNITISIDLGDFFGVAPQLPSQEEPGICDEDKLTYFNEDNRPNPECKPGFKEVLDELCRRSCQGNSFRSDNSKDKQNNNFSYSETQKFEKEDKDDNEDDNDEKKKTRPF